MWNQNFQLKTNYTFACLFYVDVGVCLLLVIAIIAKELKDLK